MGRFVMFGRYFFINISYLVNRISGIQTKSNILVGKKELKTVERQILQGERL